MVLVVPFLLRKITTPLRYYRMCYLQHYRRFIADNQYIVKALWRIVPFGNAKRFTTKSDEKQLTFIDNIIYCLRFARQASATIGSRSLKSKGLTR